MTEADPAPWRPVHYLGNKLRALDSIVAAMKSVQPHGGSLWEPFAGSTVVSQSLASRGFRIHAGDALAASVAFATALLGVGRDDHTGSLQHLANEILRDARPLRDLHAEPWTQWIDEESESLVARDGDALLQIGAHIPQRWRRIPGDEGLESQFHLVDAAARSRTVHPLGLVSSTYAGTYFGISQAVELDALRAAIDRAVPAASQRTAWHRACMLTALSHAASTAVFSPGKHFAQAHRVRGGKSLQFHAVRALTDRSISIVERFSGAVDQIAAAARPSSEQHCANQIRVEDVTAEDLIRWGIDVVYADPPYTAQQYSRFYHVLETMVEGVPARLQQRASGVTRGIYPEGRYLSPFCSRVHAQGAIGHLARISAKAGASLVFSYSDTVSSATGNARSVSLDTLVRELQQAYGQDAVSVERMNFRYRQFNSTAASVVKREDPEFLVSAKIGGLDAG